MKWITDRAFAGIEPADVFHRERAAHGVKNDTERQNSHILFRKRFRLETLPRKAVAAVSADDRYKLYLINPATNQLLTIEEKYDIIV